MTKNISEASQDARLTVGDLITELCRWPDQATIKFKCSDGATELCFARIDGHTRGIVEIDLQSVPEVAPVVPA